MTGIKYRTGVDFWLDLAASYGIDEAKRIASEYLAMQADPDDGERRFCAELTDAMNLALARKGA